MKRLYSGLILFTVASSLLCVPGPNASDTRHEQLWHHRNLGKAFYENPTTQHQAVGEFKKALDLAPDSPRERVNYGLALLRAGRTAEGVAELERAQKQDPGIPHTWFNLGIVFKRESEYEKSIRQFEQMVRLVPDEPVSHYNLGVLYKLQGQSEPALRHFEIAAKLDPNLAGPHFQLYNAYRQEGRNDESARELAVFQEIKRRQAGAAIPEDLEWSFYSEIYETIEPGPAEKEPGELKFAERKLGVQLDSQGGGLTVLDADGDGRPDLLAWSAKRAALLKHGTMESQDPALAALRDVVSITPGDFDNDGLADLCVLTNGGAVLYQNQKGTFQKHSAPLPQLPFLKAVWLDYDHDYDVDLFLFGERSMLLRNNGAGGFSDETQSFPFVSGKAVDATPFDLVADTSGKDLVVVYLDRTAVLYRDRLAAKYEAVPIDSVPAGAGSISAIDLDNDSWTDLVAASNSGIRLLKNTEGVLDVSILANNANPPVVFGDFENRGFADLFAAGALYRNLGRGRFAPDARASFGEIRAAAAADFDEDGKIDLALLRASGELSHFRNESPAGHNWFRLSLLGVKNLKLAPGAQVEIKVGSLYQKRTYAGVPVHFGLRSAGELDTVRITWPNGLIQNQPRQPGGKAEAFKEAQRLSGSCPMIFTWNGSSFEFITDVLGVAPLGASAGVGEYFPVDHDEYIQIPGESLVARDGAYEVRVTEELREVSYLDQIQLIALDHPAEVEIFTNDKFKAPPFPPFRLYGARNRIYPKAARDTRGRDALALLKKRDRAYPEGFRRTYAGVADFHHLYLDFGGAAADNRAVLIMNGWVDWADGSTFLGAAQEPNGGLVLPYLQVKDSRGEWRTVIEDMGIPAGKPKTIAVDLTGKFLSESREIRIATNLCVYWDEIFLTEDDSNPPVRLTPMEASAADLQFRGFSTPVIHPERRQPESFDYSRPMPLSMWNPTPGSYTRYGDVRALLGDIDDRMVIMGSGDELRLRFPAGGLPPLPRGWQRDFLLYVDGWAKDGDANTAYSQSVNPLPFHGMTSYPYPAAEHYPDDPVHRLYREHYNTRPALRLIRPLTGRGMR